MASRILERASSDSIFVSLVPADTTESFNVGQLHYVDVHWKGADLPARHTTDWSCALALLGFVFGWYVGRMLRRSGL